MAAAVIQIGIPTRSRYTCYFLASLFVDVMKTFPNFWYFKEHPYIEVGASEPHFIGLDERKNL